MVVVKLIQKEELLKRLTEVMGDDKLARKAYGVFESEMEKEKERRHKVQMVGIKRARENGVSLGRPVKQLPEYFPKIFERFQRGEISAAQAADLCGMGMSTFYRKAKHYELPEK